MRPRRQAGGNLLANTLRQARSGNRQALSRIQEGKCGRGDRSVDPALGLTWYIGNRHALQLPRIRSSPSAIDLSLGRVARIAAADGGNRTIDKIEMAKTDAGELCIYSCIARFTSHSGRSGGTIDPGAAAAALDLDLARPAGLDESAIAGGGGSGLQAGVI